MTDEQRDRLVEILGSINDQATKNKLERTYEEVKQQLHVFIEQHRIKPEDLPSYNIREVVMGCDSMTIITPSGRYVHVSAEPSHGDSVVFGVDYPDIEDAHKMGILSQEQYDEYKGVQQAWLGQRRETGIRDRMASVVRELGADTVQEYLNGLNQ